jgi:hypothetical protein
MVPLNRDSGRNSGRFSFVEGGNRSWSPVVYATDHTSEATLKEVTVLAEIMQHAGKSSFIACPEDCGVFRGALGDGDQMFYKWFGPA